LLVAEMEPLAEHPLDLEAIYGRWRSALDAAQTALAAAGGTLPTGELARRGAELVLERARTADLLAGVLKDAGKPTGLLELELLRHQPRARVAL
jgi:hypothetical protein